LTHLKSSRYCITKHNGDDASKYDIQILQTLQRTAVAKTSYDMLSQSLRIKILSDLSAAVIIIVFLERTCCWNL